MKAINCSFFNEKILVYRGIENVLSIDNAKGLLGPRKDDELKSYLKYSPINDVTSCSGLIYMKKYTKENINRLKENLEGDKLWTSVKLSALITGIKTNLFVCLFLLVEWLKI